MQSVLMATYVADGGNFDSLGQLSPLHFRAQRGKDCSSRITTPAISRAMRTHKQMQRVSILTSDIQPIGMLGTGRRMLLQLLQGRV